MILITKLMPDRLHNRLRMTEYIELFMTVMIRGISVYKKKNNMNGNIRTHIRVKRLKNYSDSHATNLAIHEGQLTRLA